MLETLINNVLELRLNLLVYHQDLQLFFVGVFVIAPWALKKIVMSILGIVIWQKLISLLMLLMI